MAKAKLTKAQKAALKEYNFRLSEEDRFLGSVFVTQASREKYEQATKKAYEKCKSLGMTWEHGL